MSDVMYSRSYWQDFIQDRHDAQDINLIIVVIILNLGVISGNLHLDCSLCKKCCSEHYQLIQLSYQSSNV